MNVQIYKKSDFACLIGVDEAGRGPLAGPLSIGALLVRHAGILSRFAGVKDSKKLSEEKREEWFSKIQRAEEKKLLSFEVALVSAEEIDTRGMSYCLKEGVKRALARFISEKEHTLVLLDGTLHAPQEFLHQMTLIRGDERERVIMLASIVAKVTRDRFMKERARQYPDYGFEVHKGYGTRAHYTAIAQFGISPIHRKSFFGKKSIKFKIQHIRCRI